jgi:acyl-CoA thioester hydrolase
MSGGEAGEVEVYEVPIEVRPADIDELGHVNNVVYLRWVQDAAVAHWQARAAPEDQASLFWVVSRHELDYRRPAFLDTEIVARTWVGTASAREFERHTELVRAGDGKILVRARTLWVPVDAGTLRPTDVDDRVRQRFSVDGPRC